MALLGRAALSEVVAYEADDLDPVTRTGWSVVVTGTASRVLDPAELTRYQAALTSWVEGGHGPCGVDPGRPRDRLPAGERRYGGLNGHRSLPA
ncbi:pyridoxamine 5'-phosphate oxidase family protein [Streptomyces sp. NBC_00024]|uniref:pyridoxamine 5'-phosphate oxidase family protein n=1 Tax=Streptomyces sp. NBC_00024 TaxID=2903612 RepID=UPI003863C135